MSEQTLAAVKEYYGRVLTTNADLKTNACCTADQLPTDLKAIVSSLHPEVIEKYYGCGLVIPPLLEGLTVLDLGSGSGRDCFILSKLVGESGSVIGVDMTAEQLDVARKHQDFHRRAFGYAKSNVTFRQGYIEDLESLEIASHSVDLVVSNCVINLSPAKERVLREIFRVLKPGGELYFSDVYANRRLSSACQTDPTLLGECLGGAMYYEDFRRVMLDIGCRDFRVMSTSPITIQDPAILAKTGTTAFTSVTIRAFKLDIEDRCEDYGQVAYYKGTIPGFAHQFPLDDHHLFETGKPMLVCSNTAAMVAAPTRFAEHFRIVGDTSQHFGLFDCGPSPSVGTSVNVSCTVGGPCC